jgi:4-hydroxybenzoate polyprenyltransferase
MQKDILKIFPESKQSIKKIGDHFKNQSIYGGLILLGFIIAS